MKTNTNNTCPQCGAPLPPDAPAGLCPACVMAMNLATPTLINEDGSTARVKFEAPKLEEIIPLFQQLEIIELLGQGGMGAVYKARQKELDRFAALKILPKEIGKTAGFAERFAREARALGKLNHPNIVTLYEFGHVDTEDGEPLYYFLMEYVDGLNLRQLLHNGRIEAREALSIVPQICDALQYAHDEGIVHRDIKPENILLDRRGNVKVADFGLAKITGNAEIESVGTVSPSISNHQSTIGDVIMGTPKYMSPEQVKAPGEVDHRADIYALGVVFYQMLTGEMPDEQLRPPSTKVNIDVRLDEVVLRALEQKPDLRYQQASVLKTNIETIAAQKPRVQPEQKTGIKSFPLVPLVITELFVIGFLLPLLSGLAGISFKPGGPEVLIVFAALAGLDFFIVKKASFAAQRTVLKTAAIASSIVWLGTLALTLFFATAMTNESGGWNPSWDEAFFVILAILGTVLLPFCAWKLFKALRPPQERSGKRPSIPTPAKFALVFVVIGIAAFSLINVLMNIETEKNDPIQLASKPQQLKKQSTPQVIEAGMTDITLPWAWHELKRRTEQGQLKQEHVALLVDSFAELMKRKYPTGYHQPLFSLGDLFEELSSLELLTETDKTRIYTNMIGMPCFAPLPSVVEGETSMKPQVHWSSSWNDDLLGLSLLNHLKAIRVNGTPVKIKEDHSALRGADDHSVVITLPKLAPGFHRIECEIDSALVEETSIEGLDHTATVTDWPPVVKRWTHTLRGEFRVYSKTEKLVNLIDDRQRAPAVNMAISVKSITINSAQNGSAATATIKFEAADQVPLPISADVFLRLENKSYRCGWLTLYAFDGRSHSSGLQHRVSVSIPAQSVKTADITLKPNPQYLERKPFLDEIWNREITFNDVKLNRFDLSSSDASPSNISFSNSKEITITRGNADKQGFVFFSFRNRKHMTAPFQIKHVPGNAHFAKLTDEQWDWIRTNKLDVLFHFDDTNYEMLTLETQQNFIAQPMEWNAIRPEQVTGLFERYDAIGRVSGKHPAATAGNGYSDGLTSVNAFRTRDHLMGAYQIRKINDDHQLERGISIRYRTLRPDSGKVRKNI